MVRGFLGLGSKHQPPVGCPLTTQPTGPTWTVPNLAWNSGDTDPTIIVFGTQLADGTVEGRCIRVDGLHWDDELSSENARTIAKALNEAADDLDRLCS